VTILSAKRTIDLDPCFYVETGEDDDLSIEHVVDDFCVKIDFDINRKGVSIFNRETKVGKYTVTGLTITASKEVDSTTEIPITESGVRDYTDLQPYFHDKQNEYCSVISESFRIILSFFKCKFNQPFLDPTNFKNNKFGSVVWSDDTGNDYGSLSISLDGSGSFGFFKEELDIKAYRSSDAQELKSLLGTGYTVELQYQILSDAQSAIIGNNLRRGVLEMAVSSELSVKRAFFSKHSFSGDAFEYLEDKGKVKVTVLELISNVSKEVFGESFRGKYPDAYKDIDYLIRCRNKIAHRGEPVYKDDMGVLNTANIDIAKTWYKSVRCLLQWLDEQRRKNAT